MNNESYDYELIDENGDAVQCPMNDFDGKYTGGVYVSGLKAWLDENPEYRKSHGWIKHIHAKKEDVEYDYQTKYLVETTSEIDEYTLKDEYIVCDKSEQMLALEELLEVIESTGYRGNNSNILFV